METYTVTRERHRCLDDCRPEGCPGHKLELTYQPCADNVTLEKDGEVIVALDIAEFRTFMDMVCEIGPLYEEVKDAVDAADEDDEEPFAPISPEEERDIVNAVRCEPYEYTQEEIERIKQKWAPYGTDIVGLCEDNNNRE